MTESCSNQKSDLLGSRWALVLWWTPWVLILIGGFTGNLARTVLSTAGFTVMGTACFVNARRCGRRHCVYTGPLLLLAALVSLLYGLGTLPLGTHGWMWIVDVAAVGSLFFCCVLEKLFGQYAKGPPTTKTTD